MTIKLSLLSIVLGLITALPQVYGLLNPKAFGAAAKSFPRSLPWGFALMILGTVWFLVNLDQESLSDFANLRNVLTIGFAAVGIGSCVFVQDFLAVRGLAVVLLLLAKLMVDTGRPYLGQTGWVLVFQAWAYVFVVAGIWLTISPWRLRDLIAWCTANELRIKISCGLRLCFGLLMVVVGALKF